MGFSSSMRLVILGAGGHGAVVAEAAAASGWIVEGVCDDNPRASLDPRTKPSPTHLGTIDQFLASPPTDVAAIVAVGSLDARARIIAALVSARAPIATVIHPRAIVSPGALLAPGVFVAPGAIINPRASIGPHAIINSGAIVEHDCQIADNAHIAPGAVLCGGVRIGASTLVGAGARVIPGVAIGQHCVIGAGSVVVRDIPDGSTAMGCPARVKRAKRRVA